MISTMLNCVFWIVDKERNTIFTMTIEKTIMITLESSQFLVLSIQEENKIYNRNKFSMQ